MGAALGSTTTLPEHCDAKGGEKSVLVFGLHGGKNSQESVELIMTSVEVENMVKNRLTSAGLGAYLDETRDQFLQFPDVFFAEIVLKDGSKLSETGKILRGVKDELQIQSVSLDPIVRSLWGVVDVGKGRN